MKSSSTLQKYNKKRKFSDTPEPVGQVTGLKTGSTNGHKIIYKRWCPLEEKEIPYGEIKKDTKPEKKDMSFLKKVILIKSN